jgi:hypothetical protein
LKIEVDKPLFGIPSEESAIANRSKIAPIVQVASELFRTSGIDAATISDEMKAAGMTMVGFYTHFERICRDGGSC